MEKALASIMFCMVVLTMPIIIFRQTEMHEHRQWMMFYIWVIIVFVLLCYLSGAICIDSEKDIDVAIRDSFFTSILSVLITLLLDKIYPPYILKAPKKDKCFLGIFSCVVFGGIIWWALTTRSPRDVAICTSLIVSCIGGVISSCFYQQMIKDKSESD